MLVESVNRTHSLVSTTTSQTQILRLEASGNVATHGLLGKTLDEDRPTLQQMRPKSASRRCV